MKLRSVLIASLMISNAAPTSASCYLCNRSDWEEQSYTAKLGFVMGAFGEHVQLSTVDELNAYPSDLSSCVMELELGSSDLVDIVNNQYQDLDRWGYAPHIVLALGLRSVCLKHMNRARQARGDDMLEP
jgi:hypothetical protein